jgi:hypothetical protein
LTQVGKKERFLLTLIQLSYKLASRYFGRAWQGAPQEAFHACFSRGLCKIPALLLFTEWIVENILKKKKKRKEKKVTSLLRYIERSQYRVIKIRDTKDSPSPF